ncbi:PaaX family transcriptional regulator [Capillimicrobium parvum]|uniref:Transcriptional repressor PaaX n=1 Tax=Capillimicrobium parvum TaxID=2884022 RepID=A0A9E6XYL2_9ACTN|nr:PaaX family transcriptional regulator C-terminal domain-containing protein [Capillimicrobium parvum]UGS36909.1 Transcriptional repressor PaaX [Capillimicrobium parvum]
MPAPVRPQPLLFAFLAVHVLDRGIAVASQSVVDVLGRAGVAEHAARTTLSRMARRDLLARHRRGRRVYVGLTERSTAVLRDGNARVYGPLDEPWDGAWTLLRFTVPEARRRDRRALQSRLRWAGFGQIDGLWLSPREVDVAALLGGEPDGLRAFRSRALAPTTDEQLVRDAFDLDALAARYRAFAQRWRDRPSPGADPLAEQMLLNADWLELRAADPRLPLRYLPGGWPAVDTAAVFARVDRVLRGPAARAAAGLDAISASGR